MYTCCRVLSCRLSFRLQRAAPFHKPAPINLHVWASRQVPGGRRLLLGIYKWSRCKLPVVIIDAVVHLLDLLVRIFLWGERRARYFFPPVPSGSWMTAQARSGDTGRVETGAPGERPDRPDFANVFSVKPPECGSPRVRARSVARRGPPEPRAGPQTAGLDRRRGDRLWGVSVEHVLQESWERAESVCGFTSRVPARRLRC